MQEKLMNEIFWLVWNPQGNAPKHRHNSKDEAIKEAFRLARLNPDNEFFVLQALGTAKKVDVIYEELDQIPF